MYINQQYAQILVIRLYFLLDALHVSYCVSPSSEATFISCTSYLVYAGICRYMPVRLAVVWLCGYSHTTARRIGVNQTRCTAYTSCS